MTFDALTKGPDNLPRMDEDDDDQPATAIRPPVVESGKSDRLNPEVEYEVLELSGNAKALKEKLNELGQEGWQLVATTPAFIFRRIKKSEEEKRKARVGFAL